MTKSVIFIHAPKCGGTTMGSALRLRYFYSQATIKLSESTRIREILFPDAVGVDRFYREYEVRDMMIAQLIFRGIRCISAHARYKPEMHEAAKDRLFITVLRDPVTRFVSHYRYLTRRHPDSVAGLDFDAFLKSEQALRLGSEYLFYFAGRYQVGDTDVSASIAVARANLDRFDIVGDTDSMDAFQARVEAALGARLYKITRNTAPKGERFEMTELQKQRVRALCAPDIAVYEHARSLSHSGSKYP